MALGGLALGCLALALLVGCTNLAVAQQAPEGGTVKAQHGDWQVVCKPPPPGAKNEICALVQSVTAEDRNNIGLTVYFQKFSDGRRVLRVFAPLGVLLPPGLGLKIDDKDVGPCAVRALPQLCLLRPGRRRASPHRTAEERQDGRIHHLPERGGRHRHPDLARGLRPGPRRTAVAQ